MVALYVAFSLFLFFMLVRLLQCPVVEAVGANTSSFSLHETQVAMVHRWMMLLQIAALGGAASMVIAFGAVLTLPVPRAGRRIPPGGWAFRLYLGCLVSFVLYLAYSYWKEGRLNPRALALVPAAFIVGVAAFPLFRSRGSFWSFVIVQGIATVLLLFATEIWSDSLEFPLFTYSILAPAFFTHVLLVLTEELNILHL